MYGANPYPHNNLKLKFYSGDNMKCFYNGTLIKNIRGSIYVDKNRNKWKITGSGVCMDSDGNKSSVYLKVKPIEEKYESQNN